MKTELIIGRKAPADVIIPAAPLSNTVSGRHVRVSTMTAQGRFSITDLNSSNGLFVWQEQQWKRVERATVGADTRLRLGMYETSLRALCPANFLLLGRAEKIPSPALAPRPQRRPYRDPLTGEIIG